MKDMKALVNCETCEHFMQHYVRISSKFSIIPMGHCTFPRIKARKNDAPACENYVGVKKGIRQSV